MWPSAKRLEQKPKTRNPKRTEFSEMLRSGDEIENYRLMST
jgi:hypothetical protein